MPRPGTPVIPAGWEAHHQSTAEATMTAACIITRLATGAVPAAVFNPATGATTYPAPVTVYTGVCRLQRADMMATPQPIGERPVTVRRYTLSIPLGGAAVQVNDIAEITDATEAGVVGTRLRVTDVRAGSLLWQQDLGCEVWESTTR